MREVWSTELTVLVELVFATPTAEGTVVDCLVADGILTGDGRMIPPGSPFSLLIERRTGGIDTARTLELLQHWVSSGVIVRATTSAESSWLVLQAESDEVVLQVR